MCGFHDKLNNYSIVNGFHDLDWIHLKWPGSFYDQYFFVAYTSVRESEKVPC